MFALTGWIPEQYRTDDDDFKPARLWERLFARRWPALLRRRAAAPALTGRAWRAHYRERALAERGMRHRVYRGFAWRLCDCELGCNAVLRTPKQAQSHVAAHK